MLKMVVSDFYDTLINNDEAISINTMLSIDNIRNNNILFVVATSKNLRTILDYNESYIFSDYIISYNGAYVYDTNKDIVLFKKNIPTTSIRKIAKFGAKNIGFLTLNDTFYIGKDNSYNFSIMIDDVDEFIDFHKKDIYEIVVYDTKSKLTNYKKILDNMNITYFDRGKYLEIVPSGCDKLSGVKLICKERNIKLDEVLSIGCSSNDIKLVKNTFGTCVKNAEKDISSISNYKSKYNNTNGVKEIIEKYFN